MANEEIPIGFSGLMYAPSTENEVYMLVAFLREHLPYKIVFEEFEVNPQHRGYRHSKWLDARGKRLVKGKWEDITVEFKLYSSGFLKDLETHPGLKVDRANLIICWCDDASEVANYVDEVISLKPIFFSLPEDERKRIILYPEIISPGKTSQFSSIDDLLPHFSEANRPKVVKLRELWPQQAQGGVAEILFPWGARTIFRVCAYSTDHIIVTEYANAGAEGAILSRFEGKMLPGSEQISIPLENIELSALPEFVDMVSARL